MPQPNWPGTAGLPALPARAGFARQSIQLPFATVNGETNAPEIIWGTGTPNGVVSGTAGDWFLQTDSGTAWVKATPTGNTGWYNIVFSPSTFIPDFYVSPTGSSANNGSITSPWSLTYAFAGAGGAIQPGHKIALRGGTYALLDAGCTVQGAINNPVIFRQFPGERAILQGNLVVFGSPSSPICSDVWFWGFEITDPSAFISGTSSGSNTTTTFNDTTQNWPVNRFTGGRLTITGGTGSGQTLSVTSNTATQQVVGGTWSPVPDATSTYSLCARINGINGRGIRCKYINMVVHDVGATGITMFDASDNTNVPDQEAYGCIVYNNGCQNNNDHGFYVDNHSGTKTVRDNVVFNNWSIGCQFFATGPNQFLNGMVFDGNICFTNGQIDVQGGEDFLVGGSSVGASRIVVTNNFTYHDDVGAEQSVDIGWFASDPAFPNQDVTFANNYIIGYTQIEDWVTAVVRNNTFYDAQGISVLNGTRGLLGNRGNLSGHAYTDNTFYGLAASTGMGNKVTAGNGTLTAYTFAGWKAATGFTDPGPLFNGPPPDRVAVRPNQYEAGRGHIVVYNWSLQVSVQVDLSEVVIVGAPYRIHHVFDLNGAPVVQGVYQGGLITLPMTAIAPPVALGPRTGSATPPTTGPKFGAFLIRSP